LNKKRDLLLDVLTLSRARRYNFFVSITFQSSYTSKQIAVQNLFCYEFVSSTSIFLVHSHSKSPSFVKQAFEQTVHQ